MHIIEDREAFAGFGRGTLGFRPAGGGRPALRPRSAPWPGAPTGDERPCRRRARTARYRRSAQTAGVHGALIRALGRRIGPSWRLLASDGRPWASATFVGERHRFTIEADAEALFGIGKWEFDLPGHIVADVALVIEDGAPLVIEALTVIER